MLLMTSCKTLLSLFLLIVAVFVCGLLFYPMGYLYLTYENLYGEWLQFSAFFGLSVFSLLLAKRPSESPRWAWLLLGLFAFYVAGEEISWGQQLFGWQSSAFFEAQNLQGETNLHNMFTGPYSTVLKAVLTYTLSLGILAYGFVYPLALKYRFNVALRAAALGIPTPPLCLSPVFVLAAYLELGAHHFNETEVAEMLIALAMCFVAVTAYYQKQASLHRYYIAVFVGLILCAVVLTQISIHSSTSARRVENRIEAGVKKFAGRYARVGAWSHAIDLYQRHLAYEPESRSRLRRLAGAYQAAGQDEAYDSAMLAALNLDLALLETDSWRASLHRSLFKTYSKLDDLPNAYGHLNAALDINEERLEDAPNSAKAAYSMALTLNLLGRKKEATVQFGRAVELNPKRSKYRRAYRDAMDD